MVNVFPNIDTAVKHEGEAATTILQGVFMVFRWSVLFVRERAGINFDAGRRALLQAFSD